MTGHIQKPCRSKSCNLSVEKFVYSRSALVSPHDHPDGSSYIHHTVAFDNGLSHTFTVYTESLESITPVQVLDRLFPEVCKKRTATTKRGNCLSYWGNVIWEVRRMTGKSQKSSSQFHGRIHPFFGLKAMRWLNMLLEFGVEQSLHRKVGSLKNEGSIVIKQMVQSQQSSSVKFIQNFTSSRKVFFSFIYSFISFFYQRNNNCTSFFGKGFVANKGLPSGQVDWRLEVSNPRPSFPPARILSGWRFLIVHNLSVTFHCKLAHFNISNGNNSILSLINPGDYIGQHSHWVVYLSYINTRLNIPRLIVDLRNRLLRSMRNEPTRELEQWTEDMVIEYLSVQVINKGPLRAGRYKSIIHKYCSNHRSPIRQVP